MYAVLRFRRHDLCSVREERENCDSFTVFYHNEVTSSNVAVVLYRGVSKLSHDGD